MNPLTSFRGPGVFYSFNLVVGIQTWSELLHFNQSVNSVELSRVKATDRKTFALRLLCQQLQETRYQSEIGQKKDSTTRRSGHM